MARDMSRPARSLADQLAELEDPTPKDFDPEDLDRGGHSSEEEIGKASDANAGREHYQAVGKAKLRKQDPIALGKQYAGARVSRDALDAESDDDPFAAPTSDSEDDHSSNVEIEANPEVDESSSSRGVRGGRMGELNVEDGLDGSTKGNSGASSRARPKQLLKNENIDLTTRRQQSGIKELKEQPSDAEFEGMSTSDGSYSDLGEDGTASAAGPASGSEEGSIADDFEVLSEVGESEDISPDPEDEISEGDVDETNEISGDEVETESEDVGSDLAHESREGRHLDESRDKRIKSDDREELRRLMASDQKTIAATISQAAKADAAKGRAVKAQRTTFDSLLNARIKLQKGLMAINEVASASGGKKIEGAEDISGEGGDGVNAETIHSAESAALALWSTLEGLRTALADVQAKDGAKKRKRPSAVSSTTSSASLWARMTELEAQSLAHRRAVLDKWSLKVRGTSASLPNARGKLLGSASGQQQTITAVLDAHIATELGERASKRSRSSTATDSNFEPVYDDTVFYQSLLRELVEQRMSSSDAVTNGLDTLHQLPSRLPIHPVTGMRNDKVKRDVDTRASKGRKMKFNVHEKLQNFMAPEDRGSWTTRARDEFFASLLGKTASGQLREGDGSASEEDSEDDAEEGGLKLFRN